jgi:hypothetical protein
MKKKWWESLARFVAHVVVGTLSFLVLFAAAVAIDLVVNFFKGRLSAWLFTTAEWTARGLCAVDIILFVILVVVSTKEFFQGL